MKTASRRFAAPVLLAVLAVGGCAVGTGGGSGQEDASTSDGGRASDLSQSESSAEKPAVDNSPDVGEQSIISKGTVELQSTDVEAARFDLQKVIDAVGGTIADEKSSTNDDGDLERSRLVLRIPSGQFDDTMAKVEDTAELKASTRSSENVTTQVIDNEVRIRAQTKSLERVEALLAEAQNLRDIVAIESQLTRRQAELDSLKSQQAWLSNQTTLSTLTVFLERTETEKTNNDDAGFVSGLGFGWGALKGAASAIATAIGALLPFAVVFAALGVPIWLLARSIVRRRATRPVTDAPVEENP